MSGIPSEIEGFGSVQLSPGQNPEFRPGAELTTEDYFVFSRCDGRTSLRALVLMTGFPTERAIEILRKLRGLGALLLPGETPESVRPREVPRPRRPSTPLRSGEAAAAEPAAPIDLGPLSVEEQAAMAEPTVLGDRERRRIIEMIRQVHRGTHFELLGVAPTVDKRELKRAYFRLSKEFHPDRYYTHDLGPFRGWVTQIFEALSRAFETLSNDRERGDYESVLRGEPTRPKRDSASQSRGEHAADLFQQACDAEIRRDLEGALRLFAAAIRSDPQARYLRRAALCSLVAGELSVAEEYAKKGADLRPQDPSYHRVLAEVYRAAHKLDLAEETLLCALDLKTENDVLMSELRSDLAAVRAARLERAG